MKSLALLEIKFLEC